jgi:hypothetical protein
MTLHQPVLPNTPIAGRAGVFRLKALFSEERARESTDPTSREDWQELAIEWHMMANLAANANDESFPIGVLGR